MLIYSGENLVDYNVAERRLQVDFLETVGIARELARVKEASA
jgi:hypothetical protein